MFRKKIFLAVLSEFCTEKILTAYKECYDVVGIITDKANEWKTNICLGEGVYDYNIIDKVEEKIVVVDNLWNDDLRIAFNEILNRHGLQLGFEYICD